MKTTDLGLAVALSVVGYKLERIKKLTTTKCEFEFEEERFIEKDAKLFFEKNLPVDAMSFFEEMRSIKARVHSMINTKA